MLYFVHIVSTRTNILEQLLLLRLLWWRHWHMKERTHYLPVAFAIGKNLNDFHITTSQDSASFSYRSFQRLYTWKYNRQEVKSQNHQPRRVHIWSPSGKIEKSEDTHSSLNTVTDSVPWEASASLSIHLFIYEIEFGRSVMLRSPIHSCNLMRNVFFTLPGLDFYTG